MTICEDDTRLRISYLNADAVAERYPKDTSRLLRLVQGERGPVLTCNNIGSDDENSDTEDDERKYSEALDRFYRIQPGYMHAR